MAFRITPIKIEKIKPTTNSKYKNNKDIVFALDIGTRSVIGLIGYGDGEDFVVLDTEMRNHNHRCMIDGQIQDIAMVSSVVKEVKSILEKRNNIVLKEVSIAAAGRALITQNSFCERKIDNTKPIVTEIITSMEMEAVNSALDAIKKDSSDKVDFYCVGHSVVVQTLDKYPITNLVGHKGENIKIEIIAAFLPSTVVESLYTTMEESDLKIKTITLEPIAAINALIPSELRMLNLALVDIGAGTSDIAISRDGAVVSYAMATIAGDEITETLIKSFLVDFQTAERIKLSLSNQPDNISYTDILGFEYEKSFEDVITIIRPSLDELVDIICEKIKEVNKTAPTAIFLAGGGSLIPNLTETVAQKLGMDKNRVAIGSNSFLKNVTGDKEYLNNPQFVTPIGIALTSLTQNGFDFYSITINNEKVRIFNSENTTVNDVLNLSGMKSNQLIGLSGRSLVYEIDGKKITQRGGMSMNGEVKVNGKDANIRTPVKAGDVINLSPATNGKNAKLLIKDIVDASDAGELTIGMSKVPLSTQWTVNGEQVPANYEIQNYDVIKTFIVKTVKDAADYAHISILENEFFDDAIKLELDQNVMNGDIIICKAKVLTEEERLNLLDSVNDEKAAVSKISSLDESINNDKDDNAENDEILSDGKDKKEESVVTSKIEYERMDDESEVVVPVAPVKAPKLTIKDNIGFIIVKINGCEQKLMCQGNGQPPIFADATALADIDLTKPEGNICVKLNGHDTNYTTPLKDGDVIDIKWE